MAINLVFRRPPGPDSDLIEIEDDQGRSISGIGEWTRRADYWVLRITRSDIEGVGE